eukprot:GFUD01024300.1.p1 GENE.GFUD01024300.1~~GFUD01024300.1.p1  ORF type:complete len:344 (+),score=84.11 GFUD01024300.1:87-1118(+)
MADKDIFFVFLFLAFTKLSLGAGKECCSSVLLDSDLAVHKIQGDKLGFYTQLGYYGARPAYRQQGGEFFIFYYEEEQHWIDSRYFYGASLFSKLVNEMDGYCLDDHNNWSFYNGSDLMYSEVLTSNCSKIEDVCCKELRISSANSDVIIDKEPYYNNQSKDSLGDYKAIGIINGRFVYQKENLDSFLEYGGKHWTVSYGVGQNTGHIIHQGGSVCPEHIEKEWQISYTNADGDWEWKDDPFLKITCVKKMTDMTPKEEHQDTGPVAQAYIQTEHAGQASSYSAETIVLGCITMVLLSMMIAFFTRRFYRAWGRGAQGKQLLFETLDIEQAGENQASFNKFEDQ